MINYRINLILVASLFANNAPTAVYSISTRDGSYFTRNFQ